MTTMTPPSASAMNIPPPSTPSHDHTPKSSPIPTKSASSSAASTPSNNYAAPHTPIASAKRPRNQSSNSNVKSNGKTMTNGRKSRSSIGSSTHTYGREIVKNHDNVQNSSSKKKEEDLNLTPVRKMRLSEGGEDDGGHEDKRANHHGLSNRIQMSPMHKPRPAVEKDHHKKKYNQVKPVTDDHEDEAELEPPPEQPKNGINNVGGNNKWVGIFSPVLNFLNHANESGNGDTTNVFVDEEEEEEQVPRDIDGDVKMKSDIAQQEREKSGERAPTPDNASFSISYSNSQTSTEATEANVVSEDYEVDMTYYGHNQHFQAEVEDDDDDDDEDEFNPYLFIRFLPPYETVVPHPEYKICLPPKEKSDPPITLVLDLDETLVHCTVEPIPDASMVFPVYFNGTQYSVHVRTRPYLQEFLESVSKNFEVVVFTASQKVYADELLNRIDPGKFDLSIID